MTVFRHINVVIFSLFLISCQTVGVNDNNKENELSKVTDFQGVKFSSSPKNNMVEVEDVTVADLQKNGFDKIKVYYLPTDHLGIGEIKLKKILYSYYQNKLYSIRLVSDDNRSCKNAKYLKEELEQKTGASFQVEVNSEKSYAYIARADLDNVSLFVTCWLNHTNVFISEPKLDAAAIKYKESAREYIKENDLWDASDFL